MESSGTLRYSPTSKTTSVGTWWLVVDCDIELARYYRTGFNQSLLCLDRCKLDLGDQKLQKPAWDAHISVIRNEEPPDKTLWGIDNGKEITFSYDPELKTNGEYYWLNVQCEYLLSLREKLGLSRNPAIDLPFFGAESPYLWYSRGKVQSDRAKRGRLHLAL